MEFLQELWLPIVVSTVFVWIASFILHAVSPHHKGEWKGLKEEEKVLDAIRASGNPPGQYMFPWCSSMAEMKDPAYIEKTKLRPVGTLVIWSSPTNMGRNLVLMFLFNLLVGVFVAYVTWHSRQPGAEYLEVFRIAGSVAVASYCLGWMPNMIWYGGNARSFWTYLFDGIVYGLLSAGTFGWLWPKG